MARIKVKYDGPYPEVEWQPESGKPSIIFKKGKWVEIEKPKRPLPADFKIKTLRRDTHA